MACPCTCWPAAANTHDSRLFELLLETNPGVRPRRGRPDRPRRRPEKLHADKGHDHPRCRRYLHRRGITVRIARRGLEDTNHLGRYRWAVERTISWVLRYRRLGLGYDRTEATLWPSAAAGRRPHHPAPTTPSHRVLRPGVRMTSEFGISGLQVRG
jgi:transposase